MQSKIKIFNHLAASPGHLWALPSHLRALHGHLAALVWTASEFGLAVTWVPPGFGGRRFFDLTDASFLKPR